MAKSNEKPKGRTSAKLTRYINSNGETKEVINAFNPHRKGAIKLVAHPMSYETARRIAKERGYSSDYTEQTASGNERWHYNLEIHSNDTHQITKKWGIGTFIRSSGKLYISSIGFVAATKAPNGGFFGKVKPRKS